MLRDKLYSAKARLSTDRNAFTLAELLVVVAIIGILVAVSIPIFNKQVEKAREETDIANLRAAKAAADAAFIDGSVQPDDIKYYDIKTGTIVDEDPGGQGLGTEVDGGAAPYDPGWSTKKDDATYYNDFDYRNSSIVVDGWADHATVYWLDRG